jgi:hypothetical protein
MRLPEVQQELARLAAELRMFGYRGEPGALATHLERLAGEIRRKPRATNAPVTSAPMTPALRQRIRDTAARFPGMTQHDIAKLLGTNQGRVSETLAGKRR